MIQPTTTDFIMTPVDGNQAIVSIIVLRCDDFVAGNARNIFTLR